MNSFTRINKTMKTLLCFAFCAALLLTARAQPAYINYQGKLTDANGAPLASGTAKLEFNIWTHERDGTQVWGPFFCDDLNQPGHVSRAIVANGRFNVILGATDTVGRP